MSLLIDKRYYEFAYHKYFSGKDISFTQWSDDPDWDYPVQDQVRFTSILQGNMDVIKNKRVVDIGCFLGYLGSMCLKNGSSFCRFIEGRKPWLDIAQEIVEAQGYTDADFLQCDIEDTQNLQAITENFDTALLASVLYHVTNPFDVLESVSHIPNIIIESKETELTINTDRPIIDYKLETLQTGGMGAYSNEPATVLVGKPSRAWYKLVMENFGYKLAYEDLYDMPNNGYTLRLYKFQKVNMQCQHC